MIVACNCDYGCPCNVNGRPTSGKCEGGWTWRIESGHYGDTTLDGLACSVFADWPGAIHEGGGKAIAFLRRARRRSPATVARHARTRRRRRALGRLLHDVRARGAEARLVRDRGRRRTLPLPSRRRGGARGGDDPQPCHRQRDPSAPGASRGTARPGTRPVPLEDVPRQRHRRLRPLGAVCRARAVRLRVRLSDAAPRTRAIPPDAVELPPRAASPAHG